jgi:hypothetical protein
LTVRGVPTLVSIVPPVVIREAMPRDGNDPGGGLGTTGEARLARDRFGERLLGQLLSECRIRVDTGKEVGVDARHRDVVPGAERGVGREDGYDRLIVAAPHVRRHRRLL